MLCHESFIHTNQKTSQTSVFNNDLYALFSRKTIYLQVKFWEGLLFEVVNELGTIPLSDHRPVEPHLRGSGLTE